MFKTSQSMVGIFTIGLLLRFILMPFLFHPDLKTHYFHAQFLQQGVFNIYQFISDNKRSLGYTDTFNYPPLTYFFLGSWNIIVHPILGFSYDKWLNDWGENWFTSDQIFRQLFFLKIPYLIFDLLTGWLIFKILDKKYAKLGLILWLFNPISLYLIYGLSNFDIIPTFFTLLAVYLLQRGSYLWSGISLSFGIATKLFPLMFIPLFIIFCLHHKQIKTCLLFILGALSIFLLSIAFLWRDFFLISNSGLVSLIFQSRFNVLTIQVPFFLIIYLAVLLVFFIRSADLNDLILGILAICMGVLIPTQFHPQWVIWGLPFLIILIAQRIRLIWVLLATWVSLILTVLSFGDKFLTIGIFSPIIPQIYLVDSTETVVISHFLVNKLLVLSEILLIITLFGLYSYRYLIWNKKS